MKKTLSIFIFTFCAVQAQATTTPAMTAVHETVAKLLQIATIPHDGQRVRGLCALTLERVDHASIGNELLGRQFANLQRDGQGIDQFMAVVPSIIVNEFFQTLKGLGTQFEVLGETPKGSSKVGVRVRVRHLDLTISVNRMSFKVLDVEWRNVSLIGKKKFEFQRDLMAYWNQDRQNSLPVTRLVEQLMNSKMVRCN